MFSDDIVITVKNLGKSYNIYKRPQDRLKQSVIPRLQQIMGRPANRYFREFWALHDVSFDVRKGETIGIIGRNGSGKSTLLEIICGTLTPTKGTVTTHGRITAILELGSGFNTEFSGRENVYLNGAILGLTREEIDSRFNDIAEFADIGEFIDQPVKFYSSGMTVRLAFAVQAMVDPDILIVDEALAVGDEKFRRKCFARLEELRSHGTSILFVSHSAQQITELCQRVLLLEEGERLLFNDPLPVVRAYQKLIFAPVEDRKRLIQEFKAIDKSGRKKISLPSAGLETFDQDKAASFDPGLTPTTTEVYPTQGAEIVSFKILDANKCIVNILTPGEIYQFEVSGRFLEDRESISFGIHIRTIRGVTVTAQRHPPVKTFINHVRAGEHFRVTYEFIMNLLPGTYFVGGGIWAQDEPTCMHRVIDALMFRVSPMQDLISSGYVDLSRAKPVLELF
jgi:lipopolysaccharide transport system ATP-binding protein